MTTPKEELEVIRHAVIITDNGMIYEYLNEEMTTFELPDYRISEMLRIIEARMGEANERCKGENS